jgi:heme-degrading monooxygenase HmoA
MIARTWRGVTTRDDADRYFQYLQQTGLNAYRATSGNRGVYALRRISGEEAEFLLLTLWDSLDAVRQFAGADVDRAVFYPEDDHFLIRRDACVEHFDVLYSSGAAECPN